MEVWSPENEDVKLALVDCEPGVAVVLLVSVV